MKKKTALEIINEIAEKEPSKWLEEAEESIDSFEWRMKSARISLRILNEIKARKISHEMSQKVLAEKMGVSPQYVNKILRGQENLSLETICKIEKALGITLVEIPSNSNLNETDDAIFNKTLDWRDSDTLSKIIQEIVKKLEYPNFDAFNYPQDPSKKLSKLLKESDSENKIG